MFRWILAVLGGVVVLKIAADAIAEAFREHPVLTCTIGVVILFGGLALIAVQLDRHDNARRIELRRASDEYGPRTTPYREESVDHVVHHHVLRVEHTVVHEHRYTGGEAHVRREPGPGGLVVEGEVVRREIEGGTA